MRCNYWLIPYIVRIDTLFSRYVWIPRSYHLEKKIAVTDLAYDNKRSKNNKICMMLLFIMFSNILGLCTKVCWSTRTLGFVLLFTLL